MVASNRGSIPFSGVQGNRAAEGRFSNPLSLAALASSSSWSPTVQNTIGRRMMARVEDQNSSRIVPRSSAAIALSPLLPLSDNYPRTTSQLLPRTSTVGVTLAEAQMPLSMAQTPRSTPRQGEYSYYSEDAPQQYATATTPVQNQGLTYQSDYSTQDAMQRPGNYSPYSQNMGYNMQQSSPNELYEQAYPPRQPAAAAIEVLSNQFGVPPYYGDGSQHTAASVSPQQAQTQYPNISYPGRPSASQAYGAPLPLAPDENQQQFMYPNPEEGSSDQASMDAAYNQYQDALRSCFQNVRDGRMVAAGTALLDISEWLLSNAVDLGLVRDEQELHKDRSKLWNEFNMCWLAAMQKQKELLLEQRNTGQSIQQPRDLITDENLENMGMELVRHCDNMERHGLVDYQMGVWEEEILGAIQECLDLMQNKEPAVAPETAS
ncbi:hypothetical protein TWF970_009940 [Orbilia oligospora]|uniref:Uncharacterized protein n=2 Tax=Orbilia oligospora TaxID=2813651 RepID=A0A7C8VBC4_ORBOL|nr:hypothetical protein TWF970_009940 [Orbilia oligospora]